MKSDCCGANCYTKKCYGDYGMIIEYTDPRIFCHKCNKPCTSRKEEPVEVVE